MTDEEKKTVAFSPNFQALVFLNQITFYPLRIFKFYFQNSDLMGPNFHLRKYGLW